jgi:hypothetical protein
MVTFESETEEEMEETEVIMVELDWVVVGKVVFVTMVEFGALEVALMTADEDEMVVLLGGGTVSMLN